ncbi:MAG: hypothetical protein EA353_02215 [Puniceicoccaceae bacterium]|nr:MAG: hypothetical protein EA353_02215 [Puniceicoccaceae bacterium]
MATAVFLPSASVFADADAEQKAQMEQIEQIERMARMEARLLELEQRLEEAEQTNKEIKVLASNPPSADGSRGSILGNAATFDILAGSAWRDLRWTQEAQWDGVKVGATEEQVIELLGYPPRSVDSRRPRVDKVYWYEASIRDKSSGMSGKVSFRNGRVVSVEKPDFSAKPAAQRQSEAAASRQRLP